MYIYSLTHPSSNKIYIGKTNNLLKRYSNHLREDQKTKKVNWIKSLKSKGFKPVMDVIDTVSDIGWQAHEMYWISFYRSNYGWDRVLNLTAGGEAGSRVGRKHSEETKLRFSLTRKGRKLTEEHKEKLTKSNVNRDYKKSLSDETIIKIFELNNQGKNSFEISETLNITRGLIGSILNKKPEYMKEDKWKGFNKIRYKHSEEVRKVIGLAGIGNKHNLGRTKKKK